MCKQGEATCGVRIQFNAAAAAAAAAAAVVWTDTMLQCQAVTRSTAESGLSLWRTAIETASGMQQMGV